MAGGPSGSDRSLDHESVRQGAVEIRIYAADRPAEIRRHLSAGGYWSRRAKVTAIRTEAAGQAGDPISGAPKPLVPLA